MFETLEERRLLAVHVTEDPVLALEPIRRDLPSRQTLTAEFARINDDDVPDLVLTDSTGMIVELATGVGTYQRGTRLSGITAEQIFPVDIDDDGRDELLLQTGTHLLLAYLEQDGSLIRQLDLAVEGTSFAAGDLNGDSEIDLVIGQTSQVLVLSGDGNGSFGPSVSYSVGLPNADGISVFTGDLNLDGHIDIVAINGSSVHSLLNENGTGVFERRMDPLERNRAAAAHALSDVNGDRIPDLLFGGSSFGGSVVTPAYGNGDGSFASQADILARSRGQISHFQVADLNGDGISDYVITHVTPFHSAEPSGVSIGFGGRKSSLNEELFDNSRAILLDNLPRQVLVADLNQDGSSDVVTIHRAESITWLSTSETLFAGEVRTHSMPDDPTDFAPILVCAIQCSRGSPRKRTSVIADIDGDGHVDLVTSDTHQVEVFSPATANVPTRILPIRREGAWLSSMWRDGVDGDRKDNVIAYGQSENGPHFLAFYEVSNNGLLQPAVITELSTTELRDIQIEDLNGDHVADVLGINNGTIQVHYGTAKGQFQDAVNIATGVTHFNWDLHIEDLDGDGQFEVLGSTGDELYLLQMGARADNQRKHFVGADPRFGDFNGDGVLDVVASMGGQLMVRYGTGDDFSFGSSVRLSQLSLGSTPLLVADLDDDQRDDLVVSDSNQLRVFHSMADGLQLTSTIDMGITTTRISAADFSGDGNLDLLAFERALHAHVRLATGNADGTFEATTTEYVLRISTPDELVTEDVDDDGDLDLILRIAPSLYAVKKPAELSVWLNDSITESFTGDLDADGVLGLGDVDSLCSILAQSNNDDSRFDLTDDSVVDHQDLDFLLRELMQTEPGDLNVDGSVNFGDFLSFAENFGKYNATWSMGDFDCDGRVAFGDFLVFAANFLNEK